MHHPMRCEVGVLTMRNHRESEHARIFQGTAHQLAIHHRLSIIGDTDHPRLAQLADFCQTFPRQAYRDGADRKHLHQADGTCLLENILGDRRIIIDRIRIGHARNRGETTSHRGRSAALDAFLVFIAGFTQMSMDVDQARDHQQTTRIDHFQRSIEASPPPVSRPSLSHPRRPR